MKTKIEKKRDAILRIAHDAFCAKGFEATSMSQIAAELGGSKSTLYNYFSSKDEILLAVLVDGAEKFAADINALLQEVNDFKVQLLRFVESLIILLHKPQTIAILRVAVSVGGTSEVGRRFYELGTHDAWCQIAQVIGQEIQKGNLRSEDPALMAAHLRCLCEIDLIQHLMGGKITRGKAEATQHAEHAVELFLRAYGAHR